MSKEDLEFLIDLQNRMNRQDESSSSCDFQASPYFWGVAENKIEWGIHPDYCTDEVCFYYDSESYYSIEECKELFKDLLDDDSDEIQLSEIADISSWSDVEDYKNEYDIYGDIVYGRKVEDIISKYTGCFLTKQACKEHIEQNGYNYSEPHTYAMTADRNPEFERVWNILKKTDWNQISDLETKLADMEQEQIKEMQEHQEAMELADKTITNLVEDNRASQEWYKKQLADTETQNKRVLEKLELIVSANQELEQKLAESEKSEETYKSMFEIGVENNHSLLKEIEQLKQQLAEKEKEIESLKVDGVLYEELEAKDDTIIKPFLKEKLTIEEFKHIIKNLSDFDLRQTSFHDIQKNDVIFNAYINKHIAYKKCLNLLDLVDQDKIEFTIAELEKVKELVEEKGAISSPFGNLKIQASDVSVIIDNQIKAIKEMK